MHPRVFREFDRMCRKYPTDGAVLEIGATPDASTLLNLPALASARERIGINKAGAGHVGDCPILQVDATAMTCFPDERFDVVLCNSVLEHEPFFWRALAEIRRVTRIGGLVVIGAPGYARLPLENAARRLLSRIPRPFRPADGWAAQHSTLTLGVHEFPRDYYRFSERAFLEVVLAGLRDVDVRVVMAPPRIIGSGIRPEGAAPASSS